MFGCSSELAEDGLEAVQAVQEGRYDLILMDIKMPRMDGVQATQAIRALGGEVGRTPIVALTANAMGGDQQKCLAAGCDDYATKPINRPQLFELIVKHTRSRQEPAVKASAIEPRTTAEHPPLVERKTPPPGSEADSPFDRKLALERVAGCPPKPS